MRFLIVLLAFATLPSLAMAQSRVVDDTFREGREAHLQSSQEMQQKFQDDGYVIMTERAAKAEDVDAQRVLHRESGDTMHQRFNEDWNNDSERREAAQAKVEFERKAHQDDIAPRPAQWWGTAEESTAKNDTGTDSIDSDFNQ